MLVSIFRTGIKLAKVFYGVNNKVNIMPAAELES